MIFLKSLLLGLKKRIWEPIIVVLTVAIAVATFVSALTLRSSVRETAESSYRALSGECELEATLAEEYSTYYLTADSAICRTLSDTVSAYGELYAGYDFYASIGAKGQGSFAEIYATDLSRLAAHNAVTFVEGDYATEDTAVVLSRDFAEKVGARVGSYLYATRYGSGSDLVVKVAGIAEPVGIFRRIDALFSEEGASRLLSLGGVKVYNRFFIDLSQEKLNALGMSREDAREVLAAANPLFRVASPVSEHEVEVTLSYQSTLLFVIAVIVAALGAILIYTAVTLVMKDRVATASLFKSVGATNGALTLYLLAEIFVCALLGSIIGLGVSFGVSALFGALTGTVVSFTVGAGAMLLGVLFGIMLALASAFIPVLRLSYAPLYDMLHEASPVRPVGALPAAIAGGVFVALFIWTALAPTDAALIVGIFAFLASIAALFTLAPIVIKGISTLLSRVTRDVPAVGKVHLAASGAKHDRHIHSGARLLAIAIMAVVSVGVLLGEARHQLSAFNDIFRAEIMISASSETLPDIALEAREVDGVSGAYLAYVSQRTEIAGHSGNTVTLFAANGQEFDSVFHTSDLGVDVSSFAGSVERKAAIGGGLALKLGLEVGDGFSLILEGKKVDFVIASLIDTPLTLVFTDLLGLSVSPNVCLAQGGEDAYSRLAEKYALEGAVVTTDEAFGYVTDLALAYMRVFTLFEILVCLFAFAGYLNTALAAYRDRKRERELLVAAGASKSDLAKILLAENAIVGLGALILGALFSVAVLYIVQNMLKTLGLYFTLLG